MVQSWGEGGSLKGREEFQSQRGPEGTAQGGRGRLLSLSPCPTRLPLPRCPTPSPHSKVGGGCRRRHARRENPNDSDNGPSWPFYGGQPAPRFPRPFWLILPAEGEAGGGRQPRGTRGTRTLQLAGVGAENALRLSGLTSWEPEEANTLEKGATEQASTQAFRLDSERPETVISPFPVGIGTSYVKFKL